MVWWKVSVGSRKAIYSVKEKWEKKNRYEQFFFTFGHKFGHKLSQPTL